MPVRVASVQTIGIPRLPLTFVIAAMVLTLMTVMLLLMTDGNFVVAIAPTMLIGAVWYMFAKPLSHTLIGFFTVCLLSHNPGMRPHDGKWDGPLLPVGRLVYGKGVIEAILIFCLLLAFLRWLLGSRIDNPSGTSPAKPMRLAIALTLCTLAAWILFGLARGGNSQQMIWQTRQIMWGPVMSLLFIHAFRDPKWYRPFAFIIIGVAVLRSLDGIYFFYSMVKPRALAVEYSMTHEDSMLLITTLMLLVAMLIERPSKRMLLGIMCILPIIGMGLVVNHRRLAYVSLAASLVLVIMLMDVNLRRRLLRIAIVAAPIIALYVGAGVASKGESSIFAPIRSLVSVADTKNASNQTRDIENYNLLYTFGGQPFIGSGFGHEYTEVSVAYDISKAMPNYRYIAHNSVLWLLMLCGGVGFSGMWLCYVVSVFMGARVYRLTNDADTAIASLTSLCAVICYIFQAFGDMGMIGWMGALLIAVAYSVIANSATRVGAWNNAPKTTGGDATLPPGEGTTGSGEAPARALLVG